MRRGRGAVHSIAVLAVAGGLSVVEGLAGPGLGNVGRGGSGSGGTVDVIANPHVREHVSSGEALSAVRDNLVTMLNGKPGFSAIAVTDPDDPTANSFQVQRTSDGSLGRLRICETDPSIDNVGVAFASGKQAALLGLVTQVAGDGTYRLRIDARHGPDYDQTFDTSVAPTNTPEGLIAAIRISLSTFGLSTYVSERNLVIQRPSNVLLAARVESSDSGVIDSCIELTDTPPQSIPTLSQVGMLVLALLLTGAAILLLRRRRAPSTA